MKTILTLTTNHASSSYGQPVLVDSHGQAFGPNDILETGERARDFVLRVSRGRGKLIQHTDGRSPEHAEGIKDSSGDLYDLIGFSPFVVSFTGQQA